MLVVSHYVWGCVPSSGLLSADQCFTMELGLWIEVNVYVVHRLKEYHPVKTGQQILNEVEQTPLNSKSMQLQCKDYSISTG